MTDLSELIERLERATGPDPELGRAALLACGWRKVTVGYYMGPQFHWSSPGDPRVGFDDDNFHRHDPTRSLDAALTLVPEGMGWGVKRQSNGEFAWCNGDIAEAGNVAVRGGVNAPIALCIAALKARQALPQD